MGVYMARPIKDKESTDHDGKLLKCGASSMQGWRVSQEDAHNCCLDFDEDISLFAVYDGHGGHEVAEYAAKHLPTFIKEHESYLKGDYADALIESFLGFDATLKSDTVMAELAKIAKEQLPKDCALIDRDYVDSGEDEEEGVDKLREEANMPLDEVIATYASGKVPPTPRNKLLSGTSKPMSPFLRAVKASSSTSKDSEVSSSHTTPSPLLVNGVSSEKKSEDAPTKSESETPESTDDKTQNGAGGSASEGGCSSSTPQVSSSSNGEVAPSSTSNTDPETAEASSSSPSKSKREAGARSRTLTTASLLESTFDSDEEGDSSNDETFEANDDGASSSSEEVHLNGSAVDDEDAEDDDEEEENDRDDEEEVEEESEEEEDDEADIVEALDRKGGPEEPGMDSGCTAVVALVTKDKLYVANAGDSRAVLSRNGTAVDLSVDHKPEDAVELKRIQNAGGKVTGDGRVNGGLNLSRALGDHYYKRSAGLDAKEQMITALPDVVTETLDRSTDEFIVLACDGIWNSMSSQEVVNFVRPLVQKKEKLSSICEKLFENCLAPNTMGDGTGCDNMTCVIVTFNPLESSEASKKRTSCDEETSEVEPDSKKVKLSSES